MISLDLSLMTTTDIAELVLSLGSNHQSQTAFQVAFEQLGQFGQMLMSDVTTSKDHTGRTNSIYHNACVLLVLNKPCGIGQLGSQLKHIEHLCGTNLSLKQQHIVPMDIDILVVKTYEGWRISQRRLPFKQHELIGLAQVVPHLCDAKGETQTLSALANTINAK